MQRAVSTCTSPEVFFETGNTEGGTAGGTVRGDPLGLAMDALDLGPPAQWASAVEEDD
jgi:hypothetical protein